MSPLAPLGPVLWSGEAQLQTSWSEELLPEAAVPCILSISNQQIGLGIRAGFLLRP